MTTVVFQSEAWEWLLLACSTVSAWGAVSRILAISPRGLGVVEYMGGPACGGKPFMPRKPLDRISGEMGEISRRLPTKRYCRCLQTRRRLASAQGARAAPKARFSIRQRRVDVRGGDAKRSAGGACEAGPKRACKVCRRRIVTRMGQDTAVCGLVVAARR